MKKWICGLLAAMLLLGSAAAEMAEPEQAAADYLQMLLAAMTQAEQGIGLRMAEPDAEVRFPVRFTAMDMDADGVREIIVELEKPEAFLVMTWHDGTVYMDEVPYRGLLDLKDDGTYSWSNGAMNNGVARMKFVFAKNRTTGEMNFAVTSSILAMVEDAEDGSITWSVEMSSVDEETYRAYIAGQDAKLGALWYDFTEENLRLLLEK